MLAREYADGAGRGQAKPVILSHHMLYGLAAGQAKMSKSNPDSAVFMEDSPADVERKIRNAYCPVKPEAAAAKSAEDEEMQLVKDDLMNPCLDYVQHILFSREGYIFKANGKDYKTHGDVRAAFIAGEISEKTLKDQLIVEVNALLEPVRKHFRENEVAKELLSKITQWKKENLVAPPGLTRLSLAPVLSGDAFVVFAPMPSESLQLEAVLGVIRRLQQAPAGSQRVLWLEDWSARAVGCVGGSAACIRAYYELLIFGVRKLASELLQSVRICWQGEMILSGPSDYWISVINAGRVTSLESIRQALPHGEKFESASRVFASLMHIGDVMAFAGAPRVTLCCDKYHENLHGLALQMYKSHNLALPEVKLVEDPKLRLLPDGEGLEAEVNVMLTDKEIDLNKKVKKSFCMPQNISFCPPVTWVSELLKFQPEFVIKRKPDNGGDKTYTDVQTLQAEFESGALHPGDLKPAFGRALNALLEPLRNDLKEQDALKKAVKDLEAFVKAQSKKK